MYVSPVCRTPELSVGLFSQTHIIHSVNTPWCSSVNPRIHHDNISHSQDTVFSVLSVSLNIETHKYSWNSHPTAHIDLTMSAGSSSLSSHQSSHHRVVNAELLAAQTNYYFNHPKTLIFVTTGDNYLTLQAIQYQQCFRNVMCSLWSLFHCCVSLHASYSASSSCSNLWVHSITLLSYLCYS